MEGRLCQGIDCKQPAKLRCPTCIKMKLPDAFFCNQVNAYRVFLTPQFVRVNGFTLRSTLNDVILQDVSFRLSFLFYRFASKITGTFTRRCISTLIWTTIHGRISRYRCVRGFKISCLIQFSGGIRPHRQSPRRAVPEAIVRPDYALHPEGVSFGEQQARNNRIVKVSILQNSSL